MQFDKCCPRRTARLPPAASFLPLIPFLESFNPRAAEFNGGNASASETSDGSESPGASDPTAGEGWRRTGPRSPGRRGEM
ncbi:hypothetical protein GW17_00055395 [Ensete ventricosum]|nr:hypothetical protein GW17_00055395 [Ensete ventricosum]